MLSHYCGPGPGPGGHVGTLFGPQPGREGLLCLLPGVGAEVQPPGVTCLGRSVSDSQDSVAAPVDGLVRRREGMSGPCASQNLACAHSEASLRESRDGQWPSLCIWGGGL